MFCNEFYQYNNSTSQPVATIEQIFFVATKQSSTSKSGCVSCYFLNCKIFQIVSPAKLNEFNENLIICNVRKMFGIKQTNKK